MKKDHMMMKKAMLIIMDGWGKGTAGKQNAIHVAHTPFMDQLEARDDVAKAELDACGEEVGLPDGQMGNSEVGHMNIGAGRVVYQDLVRINRSLNDGTLEKNEQLLEALNYAKTNNKQVHFLGLVSDGGVHASTEHLKKLVEIATQQKVEKSFIHVLTDGRDTDPRSGLMYVKELEDFLENQSSQIASLCGRLLHHGPR